MNVISDDSKGWSFSLRTDCRNLLVEKPNAMTDEQWAELDENKRQSLMRRPCL